LAQKFKIVARRTKELGRYIEKMDTEHQKKIIALEACQPSTPPAEYKAHPIELNFVAEQIEVQVTACQTLRSRPPHCGLAWKILLLLWTPAEKFREHKRR